MLSTMQILIYTLNKIYISSDLDISFTLEEYTSSEADEQMIISVCKNKRTSAYFSVKMLVGSVTVGNENFYEDLRIPAS